MKHRIFARIMSLLLIAAMLCPVLALAEEKAEVAVTLPKSLVTIDAEAFKDTAAFGKVIVQNNTKRIESRAFANSAAKEIHLPASVEYIADDAFVGCENLTLYVPQGSYAHQWAAFGDVKYVAVSETATAKKYALSGLEFADGVAAVNVTTDAACVLRVNVLKEADESVLLSCTAAAEAKIQDAAMEVPVEGTLPAYFILEAVLEDAGGKALCEPLRDIRHSQAYANAMAAQPGDYPAERVIDFGDAGYMVLAEGVTNITADVTVSGNHYTIPTSAFGGDLPEVGDVLMLNVGGTPTPVKIGSIAPSKGDSIRIEADAELYMCDAFDKIDVNGYVEADENSIGGGIGGEIPLDETYTSEGGKLTVKATGGVSVYVNAQYDKHFFREDYFMFDAEAKVVVDVVGTLTDKYEIPKDKIKLDLYDGKIIIPGVNLPADMKITLPLNGYIEGSGSLSFHYEKMAGFTWDTDNGLVEKKEPNVNSADSQLQVDFNVNAGPKVAMTIGLWKFFTVTVDAQVGVKADGKLTGKAHAGYVPPVDDDEIHACNLCLGIDINIFADGNVTVAYKITKKIQDSVDKNLFHWEGDLLDLHWSLINDEDSYYKGVPTKALGTCPNYQYKIKVSTKDMFGKAVTGLPVVITAPSGSTISLTSPGQCHLYALNHTAAATFPSGEFSKKFGVTGPGSVVVEEQEMVINITTIDNATDQYLPGVNVKMTKPDGTTKTGTTNAYGELKFDKLRGGEYSFVFSKDSYESEKMSQTFVSGTNNGITMHMSRVKLPVLTASIENAGTVTALASDGTLPADVPKLTLTAKEDRSGFFEEIVVRHEDCKTALSYTPTYCRSAAVFGVDMGDGQYTYVLSLYNAGTGGGATTKVLRAVNGALKTYDLSLGKIGINGSFTDNTHFTATLQPSGKAISGMMPLPYSGFKRTGGKLGPMGDGYLNYVQNEDGAYDLQYSLRITQGGYNWDDIGSVMAKFVLKDNDIVMDSQWFKMYEGGVLD